ncbi:MAG TPA: metallophosphoesterase [Actinobacteria bacterium]|nr:metallophosphoesterase [Actinomycetota bacterium]
MRYLVVSDIHANPDALMAIDEPHDAVICLGDLVDYGPDPSPCIQYFQQDNVYRVRGNHDNAVAFRMDCACGEAFKHLSLETREYMWSVLSGEDLHFLGDAGTSLMLESGGRPVLAVHAAPSDHLFKYLTPDTPVAELAAEMEAVSADIVLTGHSHRPFIREFGERMLVNVGSVGQPRDGIPSASYAVLEDGRVELKRTEYDIEAAVGKLKALPYGEKTTEQLIHILRHAGTPPA